jgi:uncharacterized protein
MNEQRRNVLGTALACCCTAPMTGFLRDGYCSADPRDPGQHTVCARVTEDFLAYTRARGNDLSTPRPEFGFPGLRPGDRWCLCAARWAEALADGVAPPVELDACDEKALEVIPLEVLREHAHAPLH